MKTCGGEMLGSSVVEEIDPAESFVGLATLIVEGRVPGGARGYGEGPHSPPATASACRHECDPRAFLCKRGENLRKHALLLWRSGVPLCIEVLLCPDCPCGAARASSPDVASPPPPAPPANHSNPSPTSNLPSANTPDLLLLEQWTLTVVHHRTQESNGPGSKPLPRSAAMLGGARNHSLGLKGLFQAVRSQLHFSQLGAWWSSSGGRSPAHVVYRLSVPTGMLMASSFVRPPSVHHFPSAPLGRGTSTLEVTLSSLPRMESVPRLSCPIHLTVEPLLGGTAEKKDAGNAVSATACTTRDDGQRAGKEETPSQGWSEPVSGSGGRRRPSCPRWNAKNNSLPQADNGSHLPEPLLGESLLDPPPWERRGPVHGPGHLPLPPASHRNPLPSNDTQYLRDALLFGKNISSNHTDQGSMGADMWSRIGCHAPSSRQSSPHLCDEIANPSLTACSSRLSRQGLARRRDLPPLNTAQRTKARGSQGSPPYPFVVDDRMRMPCDRPGKHHCRHAEEDEDEREVCDHRERQPIGEKKKGLSGGDTGGCHKEGRVGVEATEDEGKGTTKKKKSLPASLSRMEMEEFLEYLRNRNLVRQRMPKRTGEEDEESERGQSPLSASVMKGPIIPHIYNPQVYHLLAEERENSLAKAFPLIAKEKPSWKEERMLGDQVCHSETEVQSPDVAAYHSSTKHCEAENGSDCQKDELDKCDTDNSSSSASPVRNSSNLPCGRPVPSAKDKARFRKSLDSAASMVFHCRTGLPLTSSPAPIRRGTRFDFDSSLNSVSAIRSALFESGVRSEEAEEEAEPGSPPDTPPAPVILAPCPTAEKRPPAESLPTTPKAAIVECPSSLLSNGYSCTPRSVRGPRPLLPSGAPSPTSASLLGSFEESVLNGRLEPVSTVQGFTAEIGASGPTGCPKHLFLPVTVFFYTLGDNDKVSTPYLSHINLGRKGYSVPRSGTVQVTLFNPLGTVVKMFVVLYDLSDMPPLSQTFLRQRTLYVPANSSQDYSTPGNAEAHKWLRYLIHLRFSSSKSGRIYLHTDIRMIIFRKSDMDTATASSTSEEAYELRSFTHGPTNPKFSPTK